MFSASLQVVLITSRSVNSCSFGAPVGGGELRVFLLQQLGHSGYFIFFVANVNGVFYTTVFSVIIL